MACPPRKNTILVAFANDDPKARAVDCHNFVKEVLKLSITEVVAIQLDVAGGRKFFVKLVKPELCDQIVINQGGKYRFRFPDGQLGTVTITHAAGLGTRTVRVFDCPLELNNDVIGAALAPYGTVGKVSDELWSGDCHYQVRNGVRRVQIALTKHVPSFLYVGGRKVLTQYEGQPRTCAICDASDHARNQCPNKDKKKGWGYLPPLPPVKSNDGTPVPVMQRLVPTGRLRVNSSSSARIAAAPGHNTPTPDPKVAVGASPAPASAAAEPKADDGLQPLGGVRVQPAALRSVENSSSDNGKVTRAAVEGGAGNSAAGGTSVHEGLPSKPDGLPAAQGGEPGPSSSRTKRDWNDETDDDLNLLTLESPQPYRTANRKKRTGDHRSRSPTPTRNKSSKGDVDSQTDTDAQLSEMEDEDHLLNEN